MKKITLFVLLALMLIGMFAFSACKTTEKSVTEKSETTETIVEQPAQIDTINAIVVPEGVEVK